MIESETHCLYGAKGEELYGQCVRLSNGQDLCSLLPNCGCGEPESTLRHYYRVLSLCDSDDGAWRKLDRHSDVDQLVLYVLDHFNLIEHGSTVWCSWRTDLGDEVLAAMRQHWQFLERGRTLSK